MGVGVAGSPALYAHEAHPGGALAQRIGYGGPLLVIAATTYHRRRADRRDASAPARPGALDGGDVSSISGAATSADIQLSTGRLHRDPDEVPDEATPTRAAP